MAIAVVSDTNKGLADDAAGTTIAYTYDISALGATMLVVAVGNAGDQAHSGVVWGAPSAQNFVPWTGNVTTNYADNGDARASIWYLVNPTAGNYTITATYAGSCTRRRIGVVALSGTDVSASPVNITVAKYTSGSSNKAEVAITTSGTNSLIFDALSDGGTTATKTVAGTNQTEQFRFSSTNPRILLGTTQTTTTAGSYTGTINYSSPSGLAYIRGEVFVGAEAPAVVKRARTIKSFRHR